MKILKIQYFLLIITFFLFFAVKTLSEKHNNTWPAPVFSDADNQITTDQQRKQTFIDHGWSITGQGYNLISDKNGNIPLNSSEIQLLLSPILMFK